MSEINNRIACVVKEVALTRQAFGQRIGISSAGMTQLCNGKNNPSAQTIALICKEFNVDEHWLRTGEGEMFVPKAEDELEAIVAKHGLSPQFAVVLRSLLELPNDQQEAIVKFVLDTAEALNKQKEDGTRN